MIGKWLRIQDRLLLDELGWHRVAAHEPLMVWYRGREHPHPDGLQQITFVCHVTITADPRGMQKGWPGAGALVCNSCAVGKIEDAA